MNNKKLEQKKSIAVDIRHLEDAFGVDLHEFSPGEIYPLSTLFDALLPHLPRAALIRQVSSKDSGKSGRHKVSTQSTEIKEFSQTKERI